MTIAMLPWPAQLARIASRVVRLRMRLQELNAALLPARELRRRHVARIIALQVHADLLRIGMHEEHQDHAAENQHRHHQPRQRRARSWPVRCAMMLGEPHHQRAQHDADQRAGLHEAQRQPALARRIHVGRGDAQLLAGADAAGEDDHAERQPDGAAGQHRQAGDERADQRQRLAEQDAGLAAVVSVILPTG